MLSKKHFVDFSRNKNNLREALLFFKHFSSSVEVLHNNYSEWVYFPLMPYCINVSKEERREFVYELPLEKDKAFVDAMVKESQGFIQQLKNEYRSQKTFQEYPVFGAFVLYMDLWKRLAFYDVIWCLT